MIRQDIQVDVKNIIVEEENFSFEYIIRVNKKRVVEDEYSDSYQANKEAFKADLENGYAFTLALLDYAERKVTKNV